MKIAIRYYTKFGNTKKLTDAIGNQLHIEALTVKTPLTEKVDVLFLGSSVYAAGVDESIKSFVRNNKDKIGMIVNFSTAALLPSTYKQVSKLAEECGVKMSVEEFHCRGSSALMHKGRPNDEDCKAVMAFAQKIVG